MIDEQLGPLLDEHQATQRLAGAGLDVAAAAPDYVRHKPDQSTVIGYRLTGRDGTGTRGYAVWSRDRQRSAAIFAKAQSLRPRPSSLGPGLVQVDDQTVFYGFPNDARLRRIRWFAQPHKIKRSLHDLNLFGEPGDVAPSISSRRTTVEVLRYKPERRVVVAIELVSRSRLTMPVVLRYTTGRDAPVLARTAEALRRNGVATPAPLAQLDDGRVGIDEFAPGEQLRTLIEHGQACPETTATAIERFHRTPPPQSSCHRSVADDLLQTERALAGLAELHPSLVGSLTALGRRLATTAPDADGPDRLIHGDLHPKNILGDPTGRRETVTFVDLERAAVGRPASDLGRLLGHAMALEVRDAGSHAAATEFAGTAIDRYRTGMPIADPELRWYTAIALIDQATLVARHLEGDWRWSSAYLAAAAFRELGNTAGRKEAVVR